MTKMIVMKFGGTSVGSADRIKNAAEIVKSRIKQNPVVVVSAVAKMTDALIRLAKECEQGKGGETLELIKRTHYEILAQLKIDKLLLEQDIKELSALSNKTKSERKLNAELLDHFQSFGERMSSKVAAMHLNNIGVKAKAFDAWDLGFVTISDFLNAEPLQ